MQEQSADTKALPYFTNDKKIFEHTATDNQTIADIAKEYGCPAKIIVDLNKYWVKKMSKLRLTSASKLIQVLNPTHPSQVNRLKGLKLKGLKLKGLNSQQIKTLKGLGPIHVPLTPLKGNFYFFYG